MSEADTPAAQPIPVAPPVIRPPSVPRPNAAMAVVRAMNRELDRQVREGALRSSHGVDVNGHVSIEGRLDLAMLAYVAEIVLRSEFALLEAVR